jgi:DNA-binding NarL/FixJ family response regulator
VVLGASGEDELVSRAAHPVVRTATMSGAAVRNRVVMMTNVASGSRFWSAAVAGRSNFSKKKNERLGALHERRQAR